MTYIPTINLLLALLTIIGQVVVALLIIALIVRPPRMLEIVRTHAVGCAFIVALIATLGSLFYSEIAGYEPCKLCWFQRILMYPQVVLLGIALWKKQYEALQSIILSALGGAIALYHYFTQIGITPALPCTAVGYSISCTKRFVMQFGYVTIPLMSATAFFLIVMIFLNAKVNARTRNAPTPDIPSV
ncbi:MAG: disulfide bond formation protein B [Patescibacteria group bacterium]